MAEFASNLDETPIRLKQKLNEMLAAQPPQTGSPAGFDALTQNDKNNNSPKPEMLDSANGSLSDEPPPTLDELPDSPGAESPAEPNHVPNGGSSAEVHAEPRLPTAAEQPTPKPAECPAAGSPSEDQTASAAQAKSVTTTSTVTPSVMPAGTSTAADTPQASPTDTANARMPCQTSAGSAQAQQPAQSTPPTTANEQANTTSRSHSPTASIKSAPVEPPPPSDEPSVHFTVSSATAAAAAGRPAGVKKSSSSRNLAESAGQLLAKGISRSQSSSLLNKISSISSNLSSIASKSPGKGLIGRAKKGRDAPATPAAAAAATTLSSSQSSSNVAKELILVTNEEDEDELGACDHEPGLEFDDSELEPKLDKGELCLNLNNCRLIGR